MSVFVPVDIKRTLLAVVLVAGTAAAVPGPAQAGGRGDTSCATTGSVDFGVDLAGPGWRFTKGDDATYADPAFDDAGWAAWSVPDNWGADPDLSGYDGYAWYRRTFT